MPSILPQNLENFPNLNGYEVTPAEVHGSLKIKLKNETLWPKIYSDPKLEESAKSPSLLTLLACPRSLWNAVIC